MPTTTFLFTDIEGSTRLWEEHEVGMRSAVARHNEILSAAVINHGGRVFNWLGDGVAAAFPSAAEALRAAVEIQQELAANPTDLGELRVRVGIHSGEVEPQDGDYLGSAVNRASRIMSTGHGGQVLVSDVTARLVPPGEFELEDRGLHRLRDLGHPENIHQLIVPGLESSFPPLRSLSEKRNNLPVQLTSFVGREGEIAQVVDLMTSHRLVTLTGVGGVGKTRVALQAAGEMVAGTSSEARFIALAPVVEPEGIATAFLEGLGVTMASASEPRAAVVRHLSSREALLVVDNCEHLVDATARLLSEILTSSPGVRVLATSRELLGVPGEMAFGLRSLDVPEHAADLASSDAGRLLLERARHARPGLEPEAHAAALVDICRRLDGVPLAIELAAARMRTLSPERVAGLLEEGFRLLTGGSRTAVPRQRTLEATIAWSHRLLDEPEREVFRRLAVFIGGFTLDAAGAVCSTDDLDEISVVDLVTALVDKSLIAIIDDTDDRFRLLETVRQFASSKLEEAGEADGYRARHAGYFRDLAVACVSQRWGPDGPDATRRIRADRDNLRQALTWSIDTRTADMAIDLGVGFETFAYEGEWTEPLSWIERALAVAHEPVDQEVQAARLHHLATAVARGPDKQRAIGLWEQAIALFAELDDGDDAHPWLVEYASALHQHAVTVYYAGGGGARNEHFRAEITRALEVAERIDHRPLIAILLGNLAHHMDPKADPKEVHRAFARAHEAQERAGHPAGRAGLHWQRARYEFFAGSMDAASEHWRSAMAAAAEGANPDSIPRFRLGLATTELAQGDGTAVERVRAAIGDILDQSDGFGSGKAGGVGQTMLVAAASADASVGAWERVATALGATGGEADRGTPIPWDLAPHVGRIEEAARTALGESAFAAAYQRGRGMSPDEVTGLLLSLPPGVEVAEAEFGEKET